MEDAPFRRDRRRASRAGWTLPELLATVAVVALSLGLLLPALVAARERARRGQCARHLQQIGLGLQQFVDARRHWPPGALDGAQATEAHRALGVPPGVEHAWLPFVLPYLGEPGLADTYRFDRDWRDPANRRARETAAPAFQCPSTPRPERRDQATSGGFAWRSAPTDYGAVNLVDASLFGLGLIEYSTSRNPAGLLRPNEVLGASLPADGASQQLVAAEVAGRPGRYVAGKRQVSGRVTGSGWADRDNDFTVHGASYDGLSDPGPCPLNCTNANEIYSFHAGGASGVFADGSVRFLAETIEMRVLAAAVSRMAGDRFESP